MQVVSRGGGDEGGTAEPGVVVPTGLSSSCLLKHPRNPEGLELTTFQRSTSSAFTPYVLKMRMEHFPIHPALPVFSLPKISKKASTCRKCTLVSGP